jgi:tRNA(Arg) A34 adenosine deaminase TadA
MPNRLACSRRSFVLAVPAAGLAAAAPVTAAPPRGSVAFLAASDLDPAERARHETHMAAAIDAAANADAPFGAVIVERDSGRTLCIGGNRGSEHPIYHGEIDAMLTCGREHPGLDWSATALYTTAEPCPMCMAAAIWTGIPEVVYGTSIATLVELGAEQIGITALSVAGAAPAFAGRIVADVSRERTDPLFEAWMAGRR